MSLTTLTIQIPSDINLKIDSIKNSKLIDWNEILSEAKVHSEKKEIAPPLTASIFKEHALRPSASTRTTLQGQNNSWMLIVILIALLLIGAVRQLNNKKLVSFFSAFFATRFAGQLQREEYAINNRVGTALLLNFVLVTALFVFQVLDRFEISFLIRLPA